MFQKTDQRAFNDHSHRERETERTYCRQRANRPHWQQPRGTGASPHRLARTGAYNAYTTGTMNHESQFSKSV